MDGTKIRSLLPDEAPPELVQTMLRNHRYDLGGDLLVYRRESWSPADETFIGWPEVDEPKAKANKRHWVARCTCTACGEDFVTGWLKGGGVVLASGPDGQIGTTEHWPSGTWDADVPGDWDGEIVEIQCSDGDIVDCPNCGVSLTVTGAKELRNGRTFQIMAGKVMNLGCVTTVLYYLVSRHFDSDGGTEIETFPMYAVAVGDGGKLHYFSHARAGVFGKVIPDERWSARCTRRDPFQRRYYDHSSINGTRVGVYMSRLMPEDMAGTTGEETGLADYIAAGGHWPVLYLEFWRKHPNIENLVKAGWIKAIDDLIEDEVDSDLNAGHFCRFPKYLEMLADFSRVKPHEMLGMSRQAVKAYKSWDFARLDLYREMQMLCGIPVEDADTFARYARDYGLSPLEQLRDWVRAADLDGKFSFPALDRYLQKQGEYNGNGLRLFMDYRDMLARNVPGPLTEIELWPPHLRQAHDRLAAIQKAEEDTAYQAGFQAIVDTWGALEWSDGSICTVLPRCNGDLVMEGKTLHHCVGGYGKSHVNGSLVIFIRHARRPERSWFTLNINVTGKQPKEIQLHGYGNEWGAHGKRLHIPAEVRSFCDKWEKNILAPVFQTVKAGQARQARERIRTA